MFSKILTKVRTKEEALQLEHEVDLLLESLYKADGGSYELALQKNVRGWVANAIKATLEKEMLEKDEFLKGLKEKIKKLKVLKLTLAFDAPDATIDKIIPQLKAV